MKKFNFLAIGAAALLLASCSQEEAPKMEATNSTYSVKVQLPADIATRAFSDGYTATQLTVAVYDAATNNYVTTVNAEFPANQLETVVNFELAYNKSYKMFFFAQSPESAEVYTINTTDAILNVDYTKMNSDGNLKDAYDCFYRLETTPVITPSVESSTIYLTRLVCQVNWGTDDLMKDAIANEDAFGTNGQYIRTTFNGQAYTQWQMLNEAVVDASLTNVTFTNFAAPAFINEEFPVEGYDYVAMQYLLTTKNQSSTFNATLDINNGGNPNGAAIMDNYSVEVSSVPVQQNFRTNIFGGLLTSDYKVTVEKWPYYWQPDYDVEY